MNDTSNPESGGEIGDSVWDAGYSEENIDGQKSPDAVNTPKTLWLAAAVGQDSTEPDPGCVHEWQNLGFADDNSGLICARCDRLWDLDGGDARDAVLSIWQSTRYGLLKANHRVDRLAQIVRELSGEADCAWCGNWFAPETLTTVNKKSVCFEHVGQTLMEEFPPDEATCAAAQEKILAYLAQAPKDLYRIWVADRSALECAALNYGQLDSEIVGLYNIDIPATLATSLCLPETVTVSALTGTLATFLELPTAISRAGRSLLLGVLACATKHVGAASGTSFAEALTAAVPSENRDRATIILDLYRQDMPIDGTVSGEMTDDLIDALLARTANDIQLLFSA